VDRADVLRSVNANPLIAAGGSGILVAAFVAVFVLVAVALLVTLIASVQRRRTEFAVMRALGVSRGQVFRLLAFEYALVAALGLLAGVYVGLVVGRRMLSFLNVTESGDRVVPPFILQTNWMMVGTAVGAVCLTFLLGMALSAGAIRRQPPGQALRQTE
jgi:ABC-type antimicrobial peptide transport system permease subunit